MSLRKKESYFGDIIKKFLPLINEAIKLEFNLGSTITISDAKDKGRKTKAKPLNISKGDEKALNDSMERLMKDVDAELSKKINNAINDNVLENGSLKDLSTKIEGLFDKKSSRFFNYTNRFQTIARTESTRVLSVSAFNTAQKIGATKKYLIGIDDVKQGEDSKTAIRKYGTPEQAIPINEPFTFTEGKKQFSYLLPPNRPNDREIPFFTFD